MEIVFANVTNTLFSLGQLGKALLLNVKFYWIQYSLSFFCIRALCCAPNLKNMHAWKHTLMYKKRLWKNPRRRSADLFIRNFLIVLLQFQPTLLFFRTGSRSHFRATRSVITLKWQSSRYGLNFLTDYIIAKHFVRPEEFLSIFSAFSTRTAVWESRSVCNTNVFVKGGHARIGSATSLDLTASNAS